MAHVQIKQRGAMRLPGAALAKKVLLLALLVQLTCDAEAMTTSCCARKPHQCTLYELLCRAGHRNLTDPDGKLGRLSSDAAAGILTLGKRKAPETRYQDRLQQFLHSSRNQAAGILTMGKRVAESSLDSEHTALNLDLERPLKYLMQPAHRESRGMHHS
uniref:Hypocretin neuropeptide precursor n=1 Tax=Silurus meridionalis TaxID=175797 RepID=H6WP36_SILME|nr:prepro-orexin [Silurus meridionalis]